MKRKLSNKQKEINKNNKPAVTKRYQAKGITLIALIITIMLHYDKVIKCSNSNGFLLSSI